MKGVFRRLAGGTVLVASLARLLAGSITLAPTDEDAFRWLDIGDSIYSAAFRGTYLYPGEAITLTYVDADSSLHGTLAGAGLKPNFAYQIKLEGIPNLPWTTKAVDWTNEQLGYAGRWWVDRYLKTTLAPYDGYNIDDREYERLKALKFQDRRYWYVVQGYLMFDYVVTTPDGAIPADLGSTGYELLVDSSFHVLFKTIQESPGTNDSAVTAFYPVRKPAYYDVSEPEAGDPVSLFAQWEPTRALPNELLLNPGLYHARLVLTEETFHSQDTTYGGCWPSVLSGVIDVTISDGTVAPGTLAGKVVSATTGRAIGGAIVAVSDADGPVAQATTDRKGKYTIGDLTPGTYTVTVTATGYGTTEDAAAITSGQTTTLDLALTPSK